MRFARMFFAVTALTALPGLAAPDPQIRTGTFALDVPGGPYFPGSTVRVSARGAGASFALGVVGPGSVHEDVFTAPDIDSAASATPLGSLPGAIATANVVASLVDTPHTKQQRSTIGEESRIGDIGRRTFQCVEGPLIITL